MNDLDLLFVFGKRATWEKYASVVKEHNLTKEALQIFKDISAWYDEDTTRTSIDWNAFATWFKHVKHPTFKPEVSELYEKIFDNLTKITASPIEADLIKSFITKDYLTRIADLSLRGAEGTKIVTIDDISVVIDEHNVAVGVTAEDSYIVEGDIHDLLAHVVSGGGYDWRLNELNKALGPLRKGDFIVMTARPDAGKTTLLASESTWMASQLPKEKHVLWFNNEEEGRKVKFRIIQAAIGWTTEQVEFNPNKAYELYEKEVGSLDKILVYDRASFTIRDVKRTLDKYDAGLIIFDQLRKVHGFEKEGGNEVGRLQLVFQQAREWAKEYAPVITVHQADGTAEGQKWIELNQLHMSKTDIVGEADAVISLGRTHEPGFEKTRFLYVPKNKLAGGPKSDNALRNGKFELTIEPEIARFRGTI